MGEVEGARMSATGADEQRVILTLNGGSSSLKFSVARAAQHRKLRHEVQRLRLAIDESEGAGLLVGDSPAMQRVNDLVGRIATSDASVLIQGETGTGKELFAQALHLNSPRAGKPFKVLNCAAVSETLLESELFGHVKGAFTGAIVDRKGLVAAADGGTLFLDEIGDMPLPMQAKLLRTLETGEVLPVGTNELLEIHV